MKPDLCSHPKKFSLSVVERLFPEVSEIMEKNHVSFSYLIGSILSQETIPRPRDLDIAIYIKSPRRNITDYYTEVYSDLCDLFKADNIDVVVLNNVGFFFKYEVVKTGRLIYWSDEEVLKEFIEDTLFYYEDLKYLKEEYRRELHRRVKEGILMAQRRLNREKIDTFIDNINRALDEIKFNLRDVHDFTTFKETKQVRELCVHYLRIALEGVLDICRHIIAVKGFGIPDMERENLIDVLGINQAIPSDLARKIRGMQGMRNAIVHVYWNLDYEKIYTLCKEDLNDFEIFLRSVMEYVEKEDVEGG